MKKLILSIAAIASVVAAQAQQRIPLFEVFSSSTCGPCKPGNVNFKSVIDGKPKSDYVAIKYQQNFPSTGDPYATSEATSGGGRVTYYIPSGSWGIPYMNIDGAWGQHAGYFTQALYDQARAVPPQYDLTGYFYIKNNVVTARLSYKAITTVPAGTKIFAALTETETEKNKKSNGETKFYNVMKKMLPSQAGTTITQVAAGQTGTLTLTYTIAGAYRLPTNGQAANQINLATEHSIEHMDSLRVIAWVQGADKTVYQAANLLKTSGVGVTEMSNTISSYKAFPNPAANNLNLEFNMKQADKINVKVLSMAGATMMNENITLLPGTNQYSVNTQNFAAGLYNLVIFDSNGNSMSERISVIH